MTRTHLSLLSALVLAGGCMDFDGHDGPIELSTEVDDWRNEVIYQVLIDRFDNGDPGNDYGVQGDDLARYQGGDWKGMENRLGYLQELGVTALWISPVVKNVDTDANFDGYHGYWTQDFEATNPHFGDLAALRSLVDAAHERDMKVVIDIVTNHVGQAFYYDMNLNGVPDITLQGNNDVGEFRHYTEYDPDFDPRGVQAFTSLGEAGPAPIVWQYDPATNHLPPEPALFQDPTVYNRKGRTVNFDDPDQLLHGDFPGGLKDIDTTRCDVKEEFVDIYAGWIEKTNADGFRIDTIKHVEYEFWRYFTQRVRTRLADQGKDNFLMFGEIFDGRDDLIGSYTKNELPDEATLQREQSCVPDGQPLSGDQLDSAFYFSQHFQAIRGVFQDAGPTDQIRSLWESRRDTWGTEPAANSTGLVPADVPINFIDNHDVARFLFWIGDRPQSEQRALLHNALAFLMFAQGIPCIYYGTEQEFRGGNDPANRERMWDTGFDTTGDTFQWTKRLIALRNAYPSIRRGAVQVAYSTSNTGTEQDAGIFAFERAGGDAGGSYALVVFNTNGEHDSVTRNGDQVMTVLAPPGTELVDVFTEERVVVAADGTLEVTVAPIDRAMFVPAAEYKSGI
ncbi:MAG: alpha-amylase family glycosyl hydrolase [Nannocystaceae bacterium]|nr:alpha-amylase family glycosyl hydrolase [bacterium]